jgi:hypothetical protein
MTWKWEVGGRQAIKTVPLGAKGKRNKGGSGGPHHSLISDPGPKRMVSLSDHWGHMEIHDVPLIPLNVGGCPTKWLAYTLAARCIEKQWGEGEDREEQSLEIFPSSFWLSYWYK